MIASPVKITSNQIATDMLVPAQIDTLTEILNERDLN